ncbi:hypothetical protein PRIPAC_93655 [Pristionchus pacificus]|uniref:Uncharacterized protein n=1 Tax=Pristionchus pacificus TaxID=54126 RepID=A0A2A6BIZ7_PRIPA|nr:hypothetical protein PRIPAC_93655 [Pristionchus pacificus]|eukprot:PDM65895.1 hypothetical protein PRIPAC_44174 [Pristionchus pacificus]
MSVTAHMRRNSSPHVHSNSIVRVNTPPRKISQPARLATNNNESSEDEGENGGRARPSSQMTQMSSSRIASSCSSCSSFNQSEEGIIHTSSNLFPSLLPSSSYSIAHLIYERIMTRCPEMTPIVDKFTHDLLNLCHAEACSIFLIDPNTRELIRLPSGLGIVGRVAATKVIMNNVIINVDNVNHLRNPYFYRQVDELTGFRTKNILCMPLCGAHGMNYSTYRLIERFPTSPADAREPLTYARDSKNE